MPVAAAKAPGRAAHLYSCVFSQGWRFKLACRQSARGNVLTSQPQRPRYHLNRVRCSPPLDEPHAKSPSAPGVPFKRVKQQRYFYNLYSKTIGSEIIAARAAVGQRAARGGRMASDFYLFRAPSFRAALVRPALYMAASAHAVQPGPRRCRARGRGSRSTHSGGATEAADDLNVMLRTAAWNPKLALHTLDSNAAL